MVKVFDLVDKLSVTLDIRVSARGEGLCLPLTKEFCLLHNIVAGDFVKASLGEHFRKKVEVDGE